MSTRRRKRVKNKPRKRSNRTTDASLAALPPMRSLTKIVPDTLRVHLTYPDTILVRNNVGAKFLSWRYRSSAYDPDPALGTGSIPGFTDLSGFYNTYRVVRMRLRIDCENAETFGAVFKTCPLTFDPGSNSTTFASYADANPRGMSKLLGPVSGMNKASIRTPWYTLPQITGFRGSEYDVSYAAFINANPSTVWYIGVGVLLPVVAVSGVVVNALVDYDVLFYGRDYQTA